MDKKPDAVEDESSHLTKHQLTSMSWSNLLVIVVEESVEQGGDVATELLGVVGTAVGLGTTGLVGHQRGTHDRQVLDSEDTTVFEAGSDTLTYFLLVLA